MRLQLVRLVWLARTSSKANSRNLHITNESKGGQKWPPFFVRGLLHSMRNCETVSDGNHAVSELRA